MKKEIEHRIGPCSQDGYVWIEAKRCDTYPSGAQLNINNGDMEGQCFIYLSTDQIREVAQRLMEVAETIEEDRRNGQLAKKPEE